jgi:hypothetical protein
VIVVVVLVVDGIDVVGGGDGDDGDGDGGDDDGDGGGDGGDDDGDGDDGDDGGGGGDGGHGGGDLVVDNMGPYSGLSDKVEMVVVELGVDNVEV